MVWCERSVGGRLIRIAGAAIVISAMGCSPGYVLRAAYEQSKILANRRQIKDVIADADTSPEKKDKLQLVLEARAYARGIGLDPGGSFTSYAEVSRDPLAWVVVASRRDSFSLHTWWFPIVGRVPYKGFFDREDAEAQARELSDEGFEHSIRGTEAFSTLGWFDDPVMSTTLKNAPTRIANTVIHESVHSTVWIPGSVAFNESLANFVGSQGAVSFFRSRRDACRGDSQTCDVEELQLQVVEKEYAFQFELGRLIDTLYESLERLYTDPSLTSEEKIARRVEVFDSVMKPFREKFPKITLLKEVNNAEIIQLKLYLSKISLFRDLFERRRKDWGAFLESIRKIQSAVQDDSSKDPFNLLEEVVRQPA